MQYDRKKVKVLWKLVKGGISPKLGRQEGPQSILDAGAASHKPAL